MLVSLSSMPEAGKCALNDCLQTRPLVTVMLWFLWLSPSCLRKKRRFFLSFLASRIYCSSRSKEIKFCNNTSATQKFLTLLMHFLRLFLKKKKSGSKCRTYQLYRVHQLRRIQQSLRHQRKVHWFHLEFCNFCY